MKRFFLLIVLFSGILFSACTNPLAKKAKSGLQVQISNDVPASVYLDDNYVEKPPFVNRELSPGEYKLTIKPDDPNLIPYETDISLKPGLLTVVTWKLAERPEYSGGVIYEMEAISSKHGSEVSFVTIPDNAIITVAGKEKMFSPVIIPDVVPGHLEFEVSLPSYGVQKHTINAIPGYRMLITVKLAKENLNEQTTTSTNNTDETQETASPATTTTPPETQTPQPATNSAIPTPVSTLPNSGKTVKIKPTNFYVSGKEVLRVRDLPNSAGTELGFAEVGKTYPYLDKTEATWVNIEFEGKSGWISGQYAELPQ